MLRIKQGSFDSEDFLHGKASEYSKKSNEESLAEYQENR